MIKNLASYRSIINLRKALVSNFVYSTMLTNNTHYFSNSVRPLQYKPMININKYAMSQIERPY